jgi:hypothetical protein
MALRCDAGNQWSDGNGVDVKMIHAKLQAQGPT